VVSAAAIRKGRAFGRTVRQYYFDISTWWTRQFSDQRERIFGCLVSASTGPFRFDRWQRVVHYRYSTCPLSCLGSVRTLAGGRFNFGGMAPLNFAPFPALYLAEDRNTSWVERYGQTLQNSEGLTKEELALTRTESVAYVSVSGQLERVIDLGASNRLEDLVTVMREFVVPSGLVVRARALKLDEPGPPETTLQLVDEILDPNWRFLPMVADTPSFSQRFGQLCMAAGIPAILYPSTRVTTGQRCLAVFPSTFAGATSEVSLDDPAPPGTTHTCLNADTFARFLET
jgi:hypothetical protein